jgi:hypothetical protein
MASSKGPMPACRIVPIWVFNPSAAIAVRADRPSDRQDLHFVNRCARGQPESVFAQPEIRKEQRAYEHAEYAEHRQRGHGDRYSVGLPANHRFGGEHRQTEDRADRHGGDGDVRQAHAQNVPKLHEKAVEDDPEPQPLSARKINASTRRVGESRIDAVADRDAEHDG